MTARNSPSSYGWVAKSLHWFMAVMILGMLAVGLYMSDMELSPQKLQLYGWHKSVGSVLLGLFFVRITWKLLNPSVAALPAPAWQRIAAKATHSAFYALMLAMPLSGWLMSSAYGFPVSVFGLFTLPDLVSPDKEWAEVFYEAHELGMLALFALIALHVLAALKHHLFDKDATLKRMLPW